ncbi:hypothetical protein GOODEAATRI_015455, partial [Goodea atripinnis]
GDGVRTSITVDFGDGHALTYSNVSSIEDGIKHIYKSIGIYRVTATGENSLGSETTMLFLHVTSGQLEHIHLSAPFVAVRNKEVNLTAVLHPSQVGTVTYIWWIGNNSEQPVITLGGSVACTFSREGINTVTVQVSAGNTILQDRKTIAVHGVREDLLLVTVLPGLPTAAEFFLLPDKQLTEGKPEKSSAHLDQIQICTFLSQQLSELLLNALNQNLVQFTLRPGVQVTVYAAHLLLPLPVSLTVNLSSRKIPGLNVYAQMQNDKEPEMMSPANPSEAMPSSQQDLVPSLEILDTECNSRPIGKMPLVFSVPPISFYTLHCLFHTILPLHCCFMTLILCFLLFLSKMVQTTGELNRYSAVGS